jgi:hypothetical protein
MGMITPSFSLTATERVLPKLALDFTTASLDPRVTFTRTTNATNPATYVNSSGYVVAATDNQPRFDYDPIALTCKGLLIEESRQNSQVQSSNFTTSWTTTSAGSTVNGDVAISPDGTQNADFQYPANGVKDFGVIATTFTWSATTYTISAFVKAGGFNYMQLLTSGGVSSSYANFDLVNGVVGTAGSSTSTITNYGNGWYRCTMTFTAAAASGGWYISPIESSTAARVAGATGDGAKGLYLWGAQREAGAFATSYIPTTSAALTRNADVATMTGTNFSDWFNASAGTFVFSSYASPNTLTVRYLEAQTGTNAVRFYNNTTGSNKVAFNVDNAGSLQCLISANVTSGSIIKVSGSFKENNFAAGLNGTLTGTDLSGLAPGAISTLYIGDSSSGGRNICTCMRKIYFYPQALTNAEVTAFSK